MAKKIKLNYEQELLLKEIKRRRGKRCFDSSIAHSMHALSRKKLIKNLDIRHGCYFAKVSAKGNKLLSKL